jgi:hypothetical protein
VHPWLHGLYAACSPERPALLRWPSVAFATGVMLTGALGVRVLGMAVLARRVRADGSGLWSWLGATVVVATGLGLSVVGDPVPLDGVQFLILPLLLLWTLTGPLLAGWMAAGGARRTGAVALAAAACASPLGYAARKVMPERFTSASSMDRHRLTLTPDAVAAARWLAHQGAAGSATLMMDWRGTTSDVAGRVPFWVAGLSATRLVAFADTLSAPRDLADERRHAVAEFYDTADAARALQVVDALHVRWVWVDAARPLRFATPRLVLRARAGSVLIYELLPAS